MKRLYLSCLSVSLFFAVIPNVAGREWIVAPNGLSTNAGALESPLDLATMLKGARASAGDTILLRGGTYYFFFVSDLKGSPGKPITVSSYPGEWAAIVDNRANASNSPVLQINGEWTIYRDFEVSNSNPVRFTSSLPSVFNRPSGLQVQAPHTKIINLVIHDVGTAIGFWRDSVDAELYGNIIYNCGWIAPDRSHGHAIYTQNNSGTKLIRDNIVFNQFGWGIHVYPNPGGIEGFDIEGNIAFNNGRATNSERAYSNILVEGYRGYSADRISVKKNATYQAAALGAGVCLACLNEQTNGTLEVAENYFSGGTPAVSVGKWRHVSFEGNTVVGSDHLVQLRFPDQSNDSWAANIYFGRLPKPFIYGNTTVAAEKFRTITGSNSGDYQELEPTALKVILRANAYDPSRATFVVYNWSGKETVAVDPAGVLKPGDSFDLRDVQNYLGPPVLSGTYHGGALALPMRPSQAVAPIGYAQAIAKPDSIFHVFIIRKLTADLAPSSTAVTRFTKTPPRMAARIEFGQLTGEYRSSDGQASVQVNQEDGKLTLLLASETQTLVYELVPQSENHFALAGLPAGFVAEFLNTRKGSSLVLHRGSAAPAVTLFRTQSSQSDLRQYMGQYASASGKERVRVDLADGQLQLILLSEPNQPIYALDAAGDRRFKVRGLPADFVLIFGLTNNSAELQRGRFGPVELLRSKTQ